jgi:hypothetical protein
VRRFDTTGTGGHCGISDAGGFRILVGLRVTGPGANGGPRHHRKGERVAAPFSDRGYRSRAARTVDEHGANVVKQLKDELAPLGDAQSFKITSQQSLGEGITAYVYRVAFKSSSVNEIIAFDANGKISGFRLTPVQ